jgi:hypothetical protein
MVQEINFRSDSMSKDLAMVMMNEVELYMDYMTVVQEKDEANQKVERTLKEKEEA